MFQGQFQMFQKEYVDKEESLKNKLKMLQDDYFNLEKELMEEKNKVRSFNKVETVEHVKSQSVVELDASKLEEHKLKIDELTRDNFKLKNDYGSLSKFIFLGSF